MSFASNTQPDEQGTFANVLRNNVMTSKSDEVKKEPKQSSSNADVEQTIESPKKKTIDSRTGKGN